MPLGRRSRERPTEPVEQLAAFSHSPAYAILRTSEMGGKPERLAQAPRSRAPDPFGAECQSPAVSGARRCRMHGGAKS
jgi:hypothetical protein